MTDLLDLMRAPPIIKPIIPDGDVVTGPVDETFEMESGYRGVEIQIHQHDDGLWMWSTSWQFSSSGSGYRVGSKWGKFANTRDDALYWAVEEIRNKVNKSADDKFAQKVSKWLGTLA